MVGADAIDRAHQSLTGRRAHNVCAERVKLLPLLDKSNVLVTDLTPQLKQIATRATTISGNVTDRIRSRSIALTSSAANARPARIPVLKDAVLTCPRKVRRLDFMRSPR